MRASAIAILVLLGGVPLATPGLARAEGTRADTPVVLRLSPDGDWLAAAREGESGTGILVAPLNPAPRGTAPQALTIGGLFAVPGGDGPRAVVGATRRQAVPLLAPVLPPNWCQGVVGLVAHAAECILPPQAPGLAPQPALSRQSLGVGWQVGPFDVALASGQQSGFGTGSLAVVYAAGVTSLADAPGLLFPMGLGSARDLSVSGLWRLAPWGGLTLGATIGESHWDLAPGTAPLALDQAAVQVGIAYGPFSGGITGRTVRQSSGTEPLWSGFDIGFAWRTPWRGELSIGAQNLLGRGAQGSLPAPAAPALDEATARTPYVRYTQDL